MSKDSKRESLRKVSTVLEKAGIIAFIVFGGIVLLNVISSKGMENKQNKMMESVAEYNKKTYGWTSNKVVSQDSLEVLLRREDDSESLRKVKAACETITTQVTVRPYPDGFIAIILDEASEQQITETLREYEITDTGWFLINAGVEIKVLRYENDEITILPIESIKVVYSSKTTEEETLSEFEDSMMEGEPFIFVSNLFDLFVSEKVVEDYQSILTQTIDGNGYGIDELSEMYCVKLIHEYREGLYVEKYADYLKFCNQYSLGL